MDLLVVVATPPERDAVLRLLPPSMPVRLGPYDAVRTGRTTVVVSGVGPAPAAAAAATALAHAHHDLLLSLGICGGFPGAAEVGDLVVATEIVAADVGADSPEGFLGLSALGWAEEALPVDTALVQRVAELLGKADLPVVTGPLLTVSTATGTDERALELASRHGAVGEAMEGRGVADAAAPHGVPVVEVRAVSNAVGRRDRAAWRIPQALIRLEQAAAALLDEGGL